MAYNYQTSSGSNVTTSVLQWTPRVGDGGKTLTCTADLNQKVPEGTILMDAWKLAVNCEFKSYQYEQAAFFFLRDFIFKKTLFEKLQYLKQEQ